MKTTHRSPGLAACLLAPGLLLFAAGCTTVDHGGAQAFSTGVTAARAQTKTAFDTIVELTRDGAIDYAAKQEHLTEDSLVEVPNAAAVAAWNAALDPLEAYAKDLSSLTSADSAKAVENSLGTLAAQFKATSADLRNNPNGGDAEQITAGQASAFAEMAGALLRAHAQKQAMKVAAQTDPEVRRVFTALADAIGKDSTAPGLRATVRANWDQRAGAMKVEFLRAGTPEGRRPVVRDYIGLLKKRDAQDELLADLRGTYLALADAHTALAMGRPADLGSAIDFVAGELKHARDLRNQFANAQIK
jgi:hypothetical protein